MAQTANQYFKEACNMPICGKQMTGTHSGDNYEIKLFHCTWYSSNIRDFMARLISTLAEALNEDIAPPRAIVFVLEDDMICYINISKFGMSLTYGRLLHYLFSEVNKLISAKCAAMPLRARHPYHPEVIWINPPFHLGFANNSERNKFNRALDTTADLYDYMWSLKLKCIWDTQSHEPFTLKMPTDLPPRVL